MTRLMDRLREACHARFPGLLAMGAIDQDPVQSYLSHPCPSVFLLSVLPGFLSFVQISGPQVGYDELGSPFSTRSTESELPALVETMLVSGCDWL